MLILGPQLKFLNLLFQLEGVLHAASPFPPAPLESYRGQTQFMRPKIT